MCHTQNKGLLHCSLPINLSGIRQAASASRELTIPIHRAAQLVKHYTAEVHGMAMNLSLRALKLSAFPSGVFKIF